MEPEQKPNQELAGTEEEKPSKPRSSEVFMGKKKTFFENSKSVGPSWTIVSDPRADFMQESNLAQAKEEDPSLESSEIEQDSGLIQVPACKHEYVRIFQRKLKGLERRLVSTKAFLPVGFKIADFGHLSEGSYCFCTKCRKRLFPKRTAADKAIARQAMLEARQNKERDKLKISVDAEDDIDDFEDDELDELMDSDNEDETASNKRKETSASVAVDELELDSLQLEELGESSTASDAEEDL